MTIFVIGLVAAVVISGVYVALGARDFQRIRRELRRSAEQDARALEEAADARDERLDPGQETIGFAWRALGGVVASIALLYAASHLWWAWYAFPALALGTGVAISVAFIIDPTRGS